MISRIFQVADIILDAARSSLSIPADDQLTYHFADAIIASTKFHTMYKLLKLTTHLKTATSSLILKIL